MFETTAKKLHPHFDQIRQIGSTRRWLRSALYHELKPLLNETLNVCELGNGTVAPAGPKENYRAVSWNVERGIFFEGVAHLMKTHPEIAGADIYFVPETDVGMARSRNRNVARELAQRLRLHYAFTPCYVNLDKGNGPEAELADGHNEVGIHGNALLSRWPLKNPRQIILKNCKDKMRGREKRLGSQRALVVDAMLPRGALRAVCVHLDAHSSQRQRVGQMQTILDFLDRENFSGPTLIGGDWNTSTYYANHALPVFFSFWRKVAMGPAYVTKTHYPHPERYFERRLFEMIEARGFDYKKFNAMGVPTMHYHFGDETKNKNMRDWTPRFFQIFVDWAVKKAGGRSGFKIDWFAGAKLNPVAESQRVVGNLIFQGKPISDHDAILVDFQLP
ncbi:MAG: hypothetical protein HY609_03375 [Deltaproteobacteria bacterium]|nr:hypothetical protein [Deltaproteobacteria bacterium]MBI4223951.1 hypothetical protein [Deltaproteobacteria bacterium]